MEEIMLEIEQGKLRGRSSLDYKAGKYYSFQGIPYAKQPAHDLRFKAPQDPTSWEGIRDCRQEASESLSKHILFQFDIGSEYCLYLNVYTPELPRENLNPRPVMFWIHGGGFTKGSSRTDIYGPDFLMTGDVVLVTINYRLGILGFLSLEDPSLEVPGNNGLKDMVQALKWVQKNIKTFNGDSNNVTIFGESAGAAAVHLLMMSPMAEGLFHKAIMQSGCAINPWVYGSRCAKTIGKVLGFENNTEKEILEMLMAVPEEKFLEAQEQIPDRFDPNHIRPHGFVVENSLEKTTKEPNFLTEEPLDIILSGKYTKVPLMIGYTNREGMMSEIYQRLSTGGFKICTDFESRIPANFNIPKGSDLSKRIAQKIKDYYFKGSNPTLENIDDYYLLETDTAFYRGIHTTLKNHLKHSEYPTYLYRFSAETELNWFKKMGKITHPGVSHLDDLGYLFKTTFRPNFKEGSIEDIMVQKVVKLWTNFARTGNPNPTEEDSSTDVIWKPAKDGEHHFLDIGEKSTMGSNPEFERMLFWDEIADMCPDGKNL